MENHGVYVDTYNMMTEENLFVRMNRECFSPEGVDYGQLQVSVGPVAPVEINREVHFLRLRRGLRPAGLGDLLSSYSGRP